MMKPDGRPTRRWAATIGVFLALLAGLWFNQDRGIRSVTDDLAAQSLAQCREIEGLKGRVRSNAIENYARLDQNGKLLGIEITPALRAQAKKDMEATLARYAKDTCPRQSS